MVQGFLPVEALILDVEVWGLGGRTTKEMQTSYKKREELFTDQRRKVTIGRSNSTYALEFAFFDTGNIGYFSCSYLQVDLKTFASWEDSPEKMMMDMVSNPNRVQREDR